MSRSDFWSIAATLIVAGVGYFVSGKATAYGCIGLGVFIMITLLLARKKQEASLTQTATLTANPQMTAHPHQSQNISLHLPGPANQEKLVRPPADPRPQ